MDSCRADLEKLQCERDQDMEDYMEEHFEAKFKSQQQVKNKYRMKIALFEKKGDENELRKCKEQQAAETKTVEEELARQLADGKS